MATSSKGPKLKVLPFDPHDDRLDLGKRWEKWFKRFERDLKYNGCDPSKTPEIAKMALLIYAGTEVVNTSTCSLFGSLLNLKLTHVSTHVSVSFISKTTFNLCVNTSLLHA